MHELVQTRDVGGRGLHRRAARGLAPPADREAGLGPGAVAAPRGRRGLAGAALGERWEDDLGYVAHLARRAPARAATATAASCCWRSSTPSAPPACAARSCRCTGPTAAAARLYESVGMRPRGRPSDGRRPLAPVTPHVSRSARARGRAARARHRVHARGPLPAAALPRAGRGRATRSPCSTRCGGFDPGAAGRRARRPRGRGRRCTPAARTWRSCAASGRPTFTNVFDTQVAAGFAGFSAQAGYNGLLHDVLKIRLAEDGELHALGRPAADRRAAALRARRRRAPAALPTRSASGSSDARPARVGARGVPRDRGGDRRARPRRGLAAAAAGPGLDPRDRAVARELAAWRERTAAARGPPRRLGPARPDASSSSPSASRAARARARPDPRHRTRTSCAAAARDIIAAIARGRAAEPIRLDEGDRLADRGRDGPVIALAEALVRAARRRPGSPTS